LPSRIDLYEGTMPNLNTRMAPQEVLIARTIVDKQRR